MNDPKQNKAAPNAVPALDRREWLTAIAIVLLVALIAGFGLANPEQEGRIAFSLLSAVVGGLMGVLVVAAIALIRQWAHQSQTIKSVVVPINRVAVVSRHGRRILISPGPEIKINEANGDSLQLVDLREQPAPLEHACKTQDRKDVKLSGFVIWRIANAEAYLDRAQNPDEMMRGILKSAMMNVIGRYEIKPLSTRLDALPYEIASTARGQLSTYGIAVVAIFFTAAELQGSSRSSAEEEADRLRKIGEAAKEVGDRTLEYAEKMEQAKVGKNA